MERAEGRRDWFCKQACEAFRTEIMIVLFGLGTFDAED